MATSDYEESFVEGEPDLRPPEEEALEELDDETLLEQELDDEDVLEQDVEDDVLEESLEELDAKEGGDDPEIELVRLDGNADSDETNGTPLELDDVEASLDVILAERIAGDLRDDEEDGGGTVAVDTEYPDGNEVVPRQPDEFVCLGCFLLKRRELLKDPERRLCRDCVA
jgi:hypothetical protein